MDTNSGNLLIIKEWKDSKKENEFSEYLKILSFNDLINESNELMKEMKIQSSGLEIMAKTKSLMQEFSNRLDKESKFLAKKVIKMKDQIDSKH